MSADSPIDDQWPNSEQQDPSQNYALSGRIMLASIITLFVVVVFLVLLHLYSRWYLHRLHYRNYTRRRSNRRNRSTRFVYYFDNNRASASPTGGLDASVLKSLPLFVYSPETHANLPECAVCLSEFEQGETGRVLPNCKHSFHTGCIDMWFYSNSTCPLCRSPVEPVCTEITGCVHEPGSSTSLSSPVQQWPELVETTSLDNRRKRIDVRIDVPNRSDTITEDEFRSPGSRLLSLKKIINMGKKSPMVSPSSGVRTSCVPVVGASDVESASQEADHESSRQGTVGENYENGHLGDCC